MATEIRQLITLDFETYFSKEYSLRLKQYNTSGYIEDEQFKAQCVGIKINDQPVVWIRDRDVASALHSIDWSTTALLCHHTAFDGYILSYHYGIVPAYYYDTLSMGRALHSNNIGASLDSLAAFYHIGNKLPDVLDKTKGIRDLPDELMTSLGQYCALDTELCYQLFQRMKDNFSTDELDLIDMTVRMFCDPVLELDLPRVQQALTDEIVQREATIKNSGVPLSVLSSSPKFAKALEDLGAEIPTKISERTQREAYAFSKTDLPFLELLHHEDPRVQALVKGRFAAKSTIGESRAKRFLDAGAHRNKLPIYLSYYGAHTGRWSAGNKMNMQNLKRGGELRRSIMAPKGHVIVVADSAQIEARVTAWLAGDEELLDLFRAGADVYKYMASQIYEVPVADITKDQRFIGKIAVLGLGYGMGAAKFQHTLATGAMGPAVHLSYAECQAIIDKYRSARYRIVGVWRAFEKMLFSLYRKQPKEYKDILQFRDSKVFMPNGMYLSYPHLTGTYDNIMDRIVDYRYYDLMTVMRSKFTGGLKPEDGKKIYGGLMTENIVQALARIVISTQMLHIKRSIMDLKHPGANVYASAGGLTGRIVTMTHDEIVVCCPDKQADDMLKLMIDTMRTPPSWCLDLPLNAEGGWDSNYSK